MADLNRVKTILQQPRTTRLEDIGINSRCSQCGYTELICHTKVK